jgi:hypothetical protein
MAQGLNGSMAQRLNGSTAQRQSGYKAFTPLCHCAFAQLVFYNSHLSMSIPPQIYKVWMRFERII